MKRRLALAGLGLLALTGCVTQPTQKDMSAFKAAAPRSILVVPVINKSLDVDAPNYVLSALPVPIAEKGYYVLEQEGFYEGEKIHQQPASTLARLFGSDSVLYVTINRWDARYVVLSTTVTVDFSYRLVSRDDVEIWSERKQMQYTPDNNNNNAVSPMAAMLSAVLSAALTRAAPNYMPLTRQANQQVFILGPNALPDGPYRAADARR